MALVEVEELRCQASVAGVERLCLAWEEVEEWQKLVEVEVEVELGCSSVYRPPLRSSGQSPFGANGAVCGGVRWVKRAFVGELGVENEGLCS